MRLREYLTENNVDSLVNILKRDCDVFLKEIKGGKNGWVLRGIKDDIGYAKMESGLIRKKSHIDTGRKPRAATWLKHSLTNLIGRQEFGWPIRDGISTTGIGTNRGFSYKVGSENKWFGKMRIFLPIDAYKYVWSPDVHDFNEVTIYDIISDLKTNKLREAILIINSFYEGQENEADERLKEDGYPYTYQEVYTEAYKYFKKFIIDSYKENKIQGAIEMGHEVDFKCDEYYLVEDVNLFNIALDEGGW